MKHALVFIGAFALVIAGGLTIDWGLVPWLGMGLLGAGGLTLLSAWKSADAERATLEALELGARRIAEGDLETKITDSLGRVHPSATAFDRMTQELRRTQSALARSERMAAWRDIARRIAHEIKNPLLPIRVSMETLQKAHARKRPDFGEILTESTTAVLEETKRLQRIVEEFSDFARMPSPVHSEVAVAPLLEHLSLLFSNVVVENHTDDAAIDGDRDQLVQLLVNLVKNALEASGAANTSSNQVARLRATKTAEWLFFFVDDNGPGVPVQERSQIFDPYHTTKSTGTGLGLAIAHRIATDHDGTIEVSDSDLGGARFEVRLPRN